MRYSDAVLQDTFGDTEVPELPKRMLELLKFKNWNDGLRKEYHWKIEDRQSYDIVLDACKETGRKEGRKEGREEGEKIGLEKGEQIGLEKARLQMAKSMKENGFSEEQIKIVLKGMQLKEMQ